MATEAKYRDDENLKFLANSNFEDLMVLANVLMLDVDGGDQWTGGLKNTLVKNMEFYSSNEELYKQSWKAIAAELQLFGGDSAVNLVRGKGVLYKEILYDVADKIDVDFHEESSSINDIEKKILLKFFKNQVPDLNSMDTIYQILKDKGYLGLSSLRDKPLETVKNALGVGTASASVASSLIAGLNIAKNMVKINPLFTLATLPLTAKDITAPAYRITIPAVCVIAIMRKKYTQNYEDVF